MGLPWWLRICLQCGRPRFDPWVGKIPWRRKWQPIPVLLPGEFHGGRSLASYSPWGHKESDMTERLTQVKSVIRFPGGTVVGNLPANAEDARDVSLIRGLGRFLGGGNGNLLQYSCLENSMDRGAWQAIVHGITRVRHSLGTKPPPPPPSKAGLVTPCKAFTPSELHFPHHERGLMRSTPEDPCWWFLDAYLILACGLLHCAKHGPHLKCPLLWVQGTPLGG